MSIHLRLACIVVLVSWTLSEGTYASDWARFRGPNGSGISTDRQELPVKWSETENLKWKAELPGPGLSSPIVVGKRVFVTCWTGYGMDRRDPGEQSDLKRHLICIDRQTGKTLWSQAVGPYLPEDLYRGMFTQHGYASHTPVSDGERIYAFFGKTGVMAFDLDGKILWQKNVGTGSGIRGWGTASSPILYKNLVIVTASAESESLVAFDRGTGKEVWRQEVESLAGTWSTPILVDVGDGRQDLVLAVPYEIRGRLRAQARSEVRVAGAEPLRYERRVQRHAGRQRRPVVHPVQSDAFLCCQTRAVIRRFTYTLAVRRVSSGPEPVQTRTGTTAGRPHRSG